MGIWRVGNMKRLLRCTTALAAAVALLQPTFVMVATAQQAPSLVTGQPIEDSFRDDEVRRHYSEPEFVDPDRNRDRDRDRGTGSNINTLPGFTAPIIGTVNGVTIVNGTATTPGTAARQ
jgi:hypothetical protein